MFFREGIFEYFYSLIFFLSILWPKFCLLIFGGKKLAILSAEVFFAQTGRNWRMAKTWQPLLPNVICVHSRDLQKLHLILDLRSFIALPLSPPLPIYTGGYYMKDPFSTFFTSSNYDKHGNDVKKLFKCEFAQFEKSVVCCAVLNSKSLKCCTWWLNGDCELITHGSLLTLRSKEPII